MITTLFVDSIEFQSKHFKICGFVVSELQKHFLFMFKKFFYSIGLVKKVRARNIIRMTTPISNKALEKNQKVQKKKEILEFYKIILNGQGELLSRCSVSINSKVISRLLF